MCTFAKHCIWTVLLFSCLSYGFGIEEALCAEPTAVWASEVRAGGPRDSSVRELPPKWPEFKAKKVSFAQAGLEPLSAPELIKRLAAAQSIMKHSIVKSETTHTWWSDWRNSTGVWSGRPMRDFTGKMENHEERELRFDGQRCAVRERTWGNQMVPIQERDSFKPEVNYFSWLWDGTRRYQYGCAELEPPGTVRIQEGVPFSEEETSTWGLGESTLRGYYDGGSLESLLLAARSVQCRPELEEIGGSPCYVLDADTQYGKYVVWIDPAHGYNFARVEETMRKGDLYGAYRLPQPEGVKEKSADENIRFEKVDGVWVPIECEMRGESKTANGLTRSLIRHKRTEVKLNPDFNALGSFVPDDVKEGATVLIHTAPNGPFGDKDDSGFWKNGSFVPSADTIYAKSWSHALKVGDLMPDFTVKTLDGKRFRLSDHRGKLVLLHYWASGTTCTMGLPGLKDWYDGMKDYRDCFAMIGLSIDHADEPIRRQAQEYGLTWPQAQARDGDEPLATTNRGVLGIPAFVFVGPDGRIIPNDEKSVMTILKALKAQGARKAPSLGSPGRGHGGP